MYIPNALKDHLRYMAFVAVLLGIVTFVYVGISSCSAHFERTGYYWEEYDTNLVHYGNCKQADFAFGEIHKATSYKKARADGYEPCPYCLPEAAAETKSNK